MSPLPRNVTAMSRQTDQQSFPGMPTPLYLASPSRLMAWLDCPRRYRMQYLDRPRPAVRPQRAHTSVGIATHNVLRDFWDLPHASRTPAGVAELVRTSWIDVGFRDPEQSAAWRRTVREGVTDYLRGIDRHQQPLGIERSVSVRSDTIAVTGRVDRLDERAGELVVVDYKTGRREPTETDARTSLPLALYAAGAARTLRRPCLRVELHHIPTGRVVAHEHTPGSLHGKLGEAESIARDLRAVDAEFRSRGAIDAPFPPRPSAMCRWCDYRAHCPSGQLMGPEQADWAGLEDSDWAAGPRRSARPRPEKPSRAGHEPST